MDPSTILCIDDDALLLDYLVAQLEGITPADVSIIKAGNGATGLQLARECKPRLVILDLGLPDMSGFSVAAALALASPPPRVLAITASAPDMILSRLMSSRIHGLLLKSSAHDTELKLAVQEVLAGRTYFQRPVLAAMAAARRAPDYFSKILSPREIELLPLFGYGWPNDRIALYTRLSPATVRTHHQNVLMKLDLHSREELMRWAIKKGFVDFRYEPEEFPPDALHEAPVDWSV